MKRGRPLKARYGRWTVLRELPTEPPNWIRKAIVRCTCGTEATVFVRHLRSGLSRSCGCVGGFYKHGQGGPAVRTAEYRAWVRMNQRCFNPEHQEYWNNGAKGITVCPAWRESFETFFRDLGRRPMGHVLLREDSARAYEPGNARWGTRTEHRLMISAARKATTERRRRIGRMASEIIEHFDDVTVIYTLDDEYKHHVDFVAVEIISDRVFENGCDLGRGYNRKGAMSTPDFVFDPHEAEPYVSGGVKWDGCVNYEVGDPESNIMMHACGREDLEKLSRVLTTIYERCGEIMASRGVGVLDGEFKCAASVKD